jgi:hypothetical protein
MAAWAEARQCDQQQVTKVVMEPFFGQTFLRIGNFSVVFDAYLTAFPVLFTE